MPKSTGHIGVYGPDPHARRRFLWNYATHRASQGAEVLFAARNDLGELPLFGTALVAETMAPPEMVMSEEMNSATRPGETPDLIIWEQADDLFDLAPGLLFAVRCQHVWAAEERSSLVGSRPHGLVHVSDGPGSFDIWAIEGDQGKLFDTDTLVPAWSMR